MNNQRRTRMEILRSIAILIAMGPFLVATSIDQTSGLYAQTLSSMTHETPSEVTPPGNRQNLVHPTSSVDARFSDDESCGCRNVPGGYPCQSGCPKCMVGVDCGDTCGGEGRWRNMRPMDFDAYGPGGYAGPSRLAHLGVYRLRPGDQIQVFYLITRRQNQGEYRLAPGDEVLIESVADEDLQRGTLERGLVIQPDGTITVRLLGQIHAAGLTVRQLRDVLEQKYTKLYDEPSIDVTPVVVNKLAEDIRNAVGGASGLQQQALTVTVMPDGKIRLPGIGGLCVQGFSLPELKKEINLRYQEIVIGLEAEPILTQQASHFVYVLGNVANPSRIELTTPTTALGAIAQSGGHTPDGNMRQVVVLRRAEDWRLVSTMLDLQGAVYGRRPTPSDEIWLRDGDVVIVPDRPIVRLDNWIDQVFTRGIYGVIPISFDAD
ncbi:polysaccharide biosynthesis/export family protein [Roseiconus lacunae]|uniref:Polysaccharide biosynthesis/export family protein n=1 Tax=Roseiconus lacunae TaxID=2605694 RepID=A0ABT7PJX7_9BACT|nr:polysaccharide biosynthesis/export family protein [Roseiconus lacunae]MCD0462948.1 polysaccharide biosynthesis/export family protein [Roseiconus lacunae]MDM4016486.1 polysaccharide biosynthesis/export family protein [Roseiconus lacunae]WRQ49357.1 polysaccharide biosynthesis/export family protein [Stieleria sp. HD01]